MQVVERKQAVKKVKLTSLSYNSDLNAVAQDVVDKCKLVSQSKLPMVVRCLEDIMQRNQRGGRSDEDFQEWDDQFNSNKRSEMDRFVGEQQFQLDGVSLDNLDSYLEMLYEDSMEEKIKGTSFILQLARDPDNLEHLSTNEQFLGALTRIFREEAKKSMDLVINVVYIFFSFSNFSAFHQNMTEYKMGDMVMKVIELETKRDALRKEELQVKLKTLGREEQEREQKKLRATEKKQDKLLFVCFHVLMNLAEDITIERKMKKRKITSLLVQVPQCCR